MGIRILTNITDMKRIIVIITALLSIGIGSCSNNSRYYPEVRVSEFEYEGTTYLIFEKGGYKMGVVEKHDSTNEECNNN